MVIRTFHSDDTNAVIGLWERAGLTRPWNDPRKDIDRKLACQSEWFLVGLVDNKVIATAMAGYDGHRGWVNYLAVEPEFRRAGFGRAMMDHVEQVLRDVGCPKINLQVRRGNLDAIAFYEQIGFRTDDVVSLGKRLIADG